MSKILKEKRCFVCHLVKPVEQYLQASDRRCAQCMEEFFADVGDTMKTCTDCGESKPTIDFERQRKNKTGLNPKCKACRAKIKKISNERRPVTAERREGYRQRHLEKHPERRSDYYRRASLAKKFGMSLSEYEVMAAAQEHKCAICGGLETTIGTNGKVRVLSVDHNHETGVIRELLCNQCNTAIGLLNESLDTLRNAIKYLEKHSC